MKTSIFGTYDIRGRVPEDFSLDDALVISRAILSYFRLRDAAATTLVLGRDGRATSEGIAKMVKQAAAESGFSVIDLGLCPSPAVYHALHTGPTPHGIMITASHNPAAYNGFKIRCFKEPVWGDELQKVREIMLQNNAVPMAPTTGSRHRRCRTFVRTTGQDDSTSPLKRLRRARGGYLQKEAVGPRLRGDDITKGDDITEGSIQTKVLCHSPPLCHSRAGGNPNNHAPHRGASYVTDLTNRFTHLKAHSIHAIIDTGNGAAGPTVAALIDVLALTNVTLINQRPDATFPAHPPDPSKKKNVATLIQQVGQSSQPTLGIALDGDGDRVVLILEDGTHLSGDDLLALLAQPVLATHAGAAVVYDIKSSTRLTKSIAQSGGFGHFSPCGHPFIQQEMKRHNALLGGEVSGHFFFNDRYFGFDDGIYGLLRILELRANSNAPLTSLFSRLPIAHTVAEERIPCADKETFLRLCQERIAAEQPAQLITTDGVRAEYDDGWLLVRPAHTEPAVSVRCEGTTPQALARMTRKLKKIITY